MEDLDDAASGSAVGIGWFGIWIVACAIGNFGGVLVETGTEICCGGVDGDYMRGVEGKLVKFIVGELYGDVGIATDDGVVFAFGLDGDGAVGFDGYADVFGPLGFGEVVELRRSCQHRIATITGWKGDTLYLNFPEPWSSSCCKISSRSPMKPSGLTSRSGSPVTRNSEVWPYKCAR